MLHGLPNSIFVINGDIADPRKLGPDVYKHERNFAVMKIVDERIFHAESEDCDAIYPPLDHAAHGELHALRIIDRGRQKDFVVMLDGEVLEGLDYFGKEWICNFRDNQSKNAAPAGDQGA